MAAGACTGRELSRTALWECPPGWLICRGKGAWEWEDEEEELPPILSLDRLMCPGLVGCCVNRTPTGLVGAGCAFLPVVRVCRVRKGVRY